MPSRSTMYRSILFAAIVAAIAVAPAVVAQGGGATVNVTWNGESASSVPVNTQVGISGTGYRRDTQLSVCIDGGEGCTYPKSDRSGTFYEVRTLYMPGANKAIKVLELNKNLNSDRVKATTYVTVTP